jgi:hypothetical protein
MGTEGRWVRQQARVQAAVVVVELPQGKALEQAVHIRLGVGIRHNQHVTDATGTGLQGGQV